MVRSIRKVKNLASKKVLVRVDFNVPVRRGKVLDDARLKASLPTIDYLRKKKARVILVTHLGRPEGKRVPSLSVKPIAQHLGALLQCDIATLPKWNGTAVEKTIESMAPGAVVMLENIRFSVEEKDDQGTLSRDLAGLADIFVLDGFAVAHRADASVTGVARFLPAYAGLLLEQEIQGLTKVTTHPQPPFVFVIGGAKMETKVPVMKRFLPVVDYMLVGGGIVNTYLKARGYTLGGSLVDAGYEDVVLPYGKKRKVIWPVDVVVGNSAGTHYRIVPIQKVPHVVCAKDEAIYDIGPATIRRFAQYLKTAQTIVWNGAMGYFEQKPYDVGTLAVARLVASRSKGRAFGVIGGGETLLAMDMVGMSDDVDLVSTGGGAMLEFLAGKKLPGIAALDRK